MLQLACVDWIMISRPDQVLKFLSELLIDLHGRESRNMLHSR